MTKGRRERMAVGTKTPAPYARRQPARDLRDGDGIPWLCAEALGIWNDVYD
jgi:hypothetical protein